MTATHRSPSPSPDLRPDLLSLRPAELAALPALEGQPRYRAAQIFRWLHRRGVSDLASMTNVPADIRERLVESARLPEAETVRELAGDDGSVKTVSRLHDGALIESVLMREGSKRTLCVSTQAG